MSRSMSHDNVASGWWRLGIVMAAIAVIWGFLLPQLERSPIVQDRIKHLNSNGIDPAAFFYSDHSAMNRWEAAIRNGDCIGADNSPRGRLSLKTHPSSRSVPPRPHGWARLSSQSLILRLIVQRFIGLAFSPSRLKLLLLEFQSDDVGHLRGPGSMTLWRSFLDSQAPAAARLGR